MKHRGLMIYNVRLTTSELILYISIYCVIRVENIHRVQTVYRQRIRQISEVQCSQLFLLIKRTEDYNKAVYIVFNNLL